MRIDENYIKEFVKDRHEVLMTLDLDKAKEYCEKYDVPKASSDEVLLIGLHKARLHATDIPTELKEQSREWLKERGYSERIF